MTVVTRWDPFRELNALQSRMNRLFEEQQYGRGGQQEELTTGAFVPPVDIYEDEHGIQLKLEVPGIDEKDLNIKVERAEGRELPSHRAPLWQLQSLFHAPQHGGYGQHQRQLQQRRAGDPSQ